MPNPTLSRLASDYGMLLVLVLLGGFFSFVTWDEQHPTGAAAADELARQVPRRFGASAHVVVVARDNPEDVEFADALRDRLTAAGAIVAATVKGQPADAGRALREISASGLRVDAIATNHMAAGWAVFEGLDRKFPALGNPQIVTPRSYHWPNFLKAGNLLNIANQIVVIAIVAVGMTMVIITGGIDLSVGSLIALAAVVSTLLIREMAGAERASAWEMFWCCAAGIIVCAIAGMFSGLMVAMFSVPPFVATLGMMLVASGVAYILAAGQSVYQLPESFVWLGRGVRRFGVPNAVVLMLLLYAAAHGLMTRTKLGRYIYAVGGNVRAAWLSGVPVTAVLLFVYTACGGLAGLGGVVMASQLKSGSPTYGLMYELYVIAAVVVGGTSLSGGDGRILSTLIGAFIIAVIQNGMNLTGVESYTQKVVLGLVLLGAVLLDMIKKRGWNLLNPRRA